PGPLLDRMQLISIPRYTAVEKQHIANERLIPKQLSENGWQRGKLQLRDDAVLMLIRQYTGVAGVRSRERTLARLRRRAARIRLSGTQKRVVGTQKRLEEFLGRPIYRYGQMVKEGQIGTATGLAYTAVGGDTLSIEVTHYAGKGELILTGKLGEVMRESAQAAFSYIRSRANDLQINPNFYKNDDIH